MSMHTKRRARHVADRQFFGNISVFSFVVARESASRASSASLVNTSSGRFLKSISYARVHLHKRARAILPFHIRKWAWAVSRLNDRTRAWWSFGSFAAGGADLARAARVWSRGRTQAPSVVTRLLKRYRAYNHLYCLTRLSAGAARRREGAVGTVQFERGARGWVGARAHNKTLSRLRERNER